MLTSAEHPVAWAMLIDELAEARDHLGSLIDEMVAAGEIDEAYYAVRLGHVFAHLNRAWRGRNDTRLEDAEWGDDRSQYPDDLKPVG